MTRKNRRNNKTKKNQIIQRNLIRNIVVILVLIVFLFVIYRFNFSSKSELTETVKINFKEFGENISLEEQELDMEVLTDADGSKYILLPEKINGYFVQQYYITNLDENSDINSSEELDSTNTLLENVVLETNTIDEVAGLKKYYLTSQDYETEESVENQVDENKIEDVKEDKKEENVVSNTIESNTNTTVQNSVTNEIVKDDNQVQNVVKNEIENSNITIENSIQNTTEKNEIVENNSGDIQDNFNNDVETITGIKPGTRYNVYETNEKGKYTLGNLLIEVEYQTITNEEIKLYNQELTFDDLESKITVTGYIPLEHTLVCSKENPVDLENKMNEYEDLKNYQMLCVYDISVQKDGKTYQPEEYDFAPSLLVNIESKELNTIESQIDVKLIHFEEDEIQTIQNFETEQNSVEFAANSFSKYAVISQRSIIDNTIIINTYDEDKNYYLGKNYTNNKDGVNSNTYSDENLAKVTINYHGNAENISGSRNEKKSQSLPVEILVAQNVDSSKKKANIPIKITLPEEIEIGDKWDITLSYTLEQNFSIDGSSFEKFKIDTTNKIIKISSEDFKDSNEVEIIIPLKGKYIPPDMSRIHIEDNKIEYNEKLRYDAQITKGGYISANANEKQNIVQYIKCVPINSNNEIEIELIDNPFMDRPIGNITETRLNGDTTEKVSQQFGFDGWTKKDNEGYEISIDTNTYLQKLLITGIVDKENINIDLYADWKPANTVFVKSDSEGTGETLENPTNSWKNAIEKLEANKYTYENASDREANIVVVIGDLNLDSEAFSTTLLPYTVTSLYNTIDYRESASVYCPEKIILENDLQLDYLNIVGSNGYQDYDGRKSEEIKTLNYIIGNSKNLRIGRGMTPLNAEYDTTTFSQVQGGGDDTSDRIYRTVIESGKYSNIYADGGKSHKANSTLIIGCDYDKELKANNNLNIYNRIISRVSVGQNATTEYIVNPFENKDVIYDICVKSGNIGIDCFKECTKINATQSGIYIGGINFSLGTSYDVGNRILTVEGGNISNIVGGLQVNAGNTDNSSANTYMYIKGNEASIQCVVGGSVKSDTSGDRIIQVTGGTVQYSLIGGANGKDSDNASSGNLDGNVLVYVAGEAKIGGKERLEIKYGDSGKDGGESIYNLQYGTILGAGNGNTAVVTAGNVKKSHVIIGGNAKISNDVYGGGNFGTSTSSRVDILNGNIENNVYAGSNNNGIDGNVEINMAGGIVNGTIYGGSNHSGNISNNSTINIVGGTINGKEELAEEGKEPEKEAIYAGGYGKDTAILGNANIFITNENEQVFINGNIYGGSAMGNISGTSIIKIEKINTNEIDIYGKIFGAGKGKKDVSDAYNNKDITIDIDGGNYPKLTVFGGPNVSGKVNGNILIKIGESKATTVNEIYGGGNDARLEADNVSEGLTDIIYLGPNATITNVFNGGNNAGIKDEFSTQINVDGATVTGAVYGGANNGGNIKSSNIICQNNAQIANIYGAGKGKATSINGEINITVNASTINEAIYGGGNEGKTEGNVLIQIQDCNNANKINQLYGGGYGETAYVKGTNVNIENSNLGNVYGGGKSASVKENTSVKINNSNIKDEFFKMLDDSSITGGNVFGAGEGESAEVIGKTEVYISENSNLENVYGGGNKGAVRNSTFVRITSSTITGSAYGAGKGQLEDNKNGKYALVEKGATIIVEGNTHIEKNLFGGGDASNIGKTDIDKNDIYYNEQIDDANSFVYVSGAVIKGNVYGGSNRAKIFGDAKIYIGKLAVDEECIPGNISINGTVFGGGESKGNSETYEYDFNSVNKNIYIDIDAEGYDTDDKQINISGSIFGSGNNSNAQNGGFIKIKNYGNDDNLKIITSVQRANDVKISNSKIKIEGTTDSTNQYASSNYTFNRIGALTIKNNTTLYLKNGANLLASFNSMKDEGGEEVLAEVTIGNDNQINRNVDNRIYAYDGKNINISNDEAVINNYGIVKGMTFFGIFSEENGEIKAGMYSPRYKVGESSLEWNDRYFHRTYVLGAHEANQDIEKDGFYTVYEKFAEGSSMIKDQADNTLDESNYKPSEATSEYRYIEPTPKEGEYYMWYSGTSRIVHNYYIGDNGIEPLRVSKYSTHGAVELPLTGISVSGATLKLDSFSVDSWNNIILKPRNEISNVEDSSIENSNNFALVMETGNRGWLKSANTEFLLAEEDIGNCQEKTDYEDKYYDGNAEYLLESKQTPTLNFLLYNSKNIEISEKDKLLGQYKFKMILTYREGQSIVEEDVMIFVNIKTVNDVIDEKGYNAAITYGKKYNLFPSTLTNITTESSMSVFFELSESSLEYEANEVYRNLNTADKLPKNTTITMIDKSTTEDKYYYYIVKDDNGENEIRLSEFLVMGNDAVKYDEKNMKYNQNDSNYHYEAFIFIIDFSNSEFKNIENKTKITNNPKVTLEMVKDENNSIGMISSEGEKTLYNIYNTKCQISIDAQPKNLKLYIGNKNTFTADTKFETTNINVDNNIVTVYDTRYFDRKLGALITLYSYDNEGKTIKVTDALKGTYFEIGNERYYPKSDGVTRVKLADIVSNVLTDITINTENSEDRALRPGKYLLKIESFASADGIYYGTETEKLPCCELEITMISNEYGLKATIPENQVIIDRTTGYTLKPNGYAVTELNDNEASNDLDVTLEYKYSVAKPYITVELQRRKYEDYDSSNEEDVIDKVYSTEYTSDGINLNDYLYITENEDLELSKLHSSEKIYEFLNTDEIENNKQHVDSESEVYKYIQKYKIKPELKSGTYRLVFTLYDIKDTTTQPEENTETGNTVHGETTEDTEKTPEDKYQYIGDVYSYIIIK